MKTTAYSILELATVSQDLEHKKVFENSLKLAQKAEKLGYKRFWLAEHHNMVSIASSATTVLMGHIAEGTNSIRIGSGGIMLPNHSSLLIAEQFGTLGHLYPNRIDMGLGRAPGTDQATAHAIRPDRIQAVYKFPEEIESIQRYFSKDNQGAKVRATVAEGVDVPIYILGSSTDSAHLAAKKGLPYVFASHFAPTDLLKALMIYRREFQPSQYLAEPKVIACINVIAADTISEAENLSTSSIRMMIGVLTGQLDYIQPPIKMTDELRQISQNPALQRMQKYAFVGDRERIQEQTEAFLKETQADELMVASHMYAIEDRIKSYEIFASVMEELNAVPTH
ncbi:LLM class flavin-dependent oxidoreductase [Flavimarina sp. Hel_I_48]|uniref:LLM class flavin-dependent oxidoreductase n=1 Tax=Flavimarina sp. Hel_I_48 TaxID=1392488 RepID=UPI0004DED4D6|nr:LLM class flavin-dependent oxidoreductase [Flavimarina sp. Hel_I_48]